MGCVLEILDIPFRVPYLHEEILDLLRLALSFNSEYSTCHVYILEESVKRLQYFSSSPSRFFTPTILVEFLR